MRPILHISPRVAAAVLLGVFLPAAAARVDAEDLDRRLGRALEQLDARLSSPAVGEAGPLPEGRGRPRGEPAGPLSGLLRELEQRDAFQRRSFAAVGAQDLGGAAHAGLQEAREAYEESQGRLLRLVREIVQASASKGREREAAGAVKEAREILERLEEYSRNEPISAGELKVRAPRLEPGPPARPSAASAEVPRAPAAADLPGGETAIPRALREAAERFAGPVEAYEWVRNTIRPEFYHGLMKGALQTYLEGSGNDADTASLLIALLRAKGIPARYARGTVEVPAEALLAVTGASSVEAAVRVLERAGIPHEVVLGGGSVASVRMERVWAEAYVPYDNYRGTGLDARGQVWVPLDAGFKRLEVTPGIDVAAELGLDARALLDEYLAAPQAATPLEFVRGRVRDLLAEQRPGTAYTDALDQRTVVPEALGILPGVLPYKRIGPPEVGTELPDTLVHQVRVLGKSAQGETLLNVSFPVSDLLGRRLTLAYAPATREDEELVKRYGGLLRVPPYLVNVRPVLKSRGVPLAAGAPVRLGVRYTLRLELVTPGGREAVVNTAIAGNLAAIGLGGREVTGEESREDTAGEILSALAWSYLDRWNGSDEELSRLLHVVPVRPTASLCMVMSDLKVAYANPEAPLRIDWTGLLIDADLRATAPVGMGGREVERPFVLLSGLEGSILENRIFEDRHQLASVSTGTVLQLAPGQGIEVRDFLGSDEGVEELPFDPLVKAEILEAVGRGLLARVPVAEVAYLDWRGVGYLLLDEETGEAAYQLQGGHSGGATAMVPSDIPEEIRLPIETQGEEPAQGETEVSAIAKDWLSDNQEGTVNQPLETPLRVLVSDEKGLPVLGAPVTFTVAAGGGLLFDPVLGQLATEVVVLSDRGGTASVQFLLGDKTGRLPAYVLLEGDENATQVGVNLVTARSGAVALAEPFTAYGYPDRIQAVLRLVEGGDSWIQIPNLRIAPHNIWVKVDDVYGNPLSNVPIRIAYELHQPAAAPAGLVRLREPNDSPGTLLSAEDFERCKESDGNFRGECEGEVAELVVSSHVLGATAYPIPGSSPYTQYLFGVGTPDQPNQIPVWYGTWGPLCRGTAEHCQRRVGYKPLSMNGLSIRLPLTNDRGHMIEAYPTGGSARVHFTTAGLYERERIELETDPGGDTYFRAYGTNEWYWERLMDSEITLTARSAGTLVQDTAGHVEGGRYEAVMTMSETPQLNVIDLNAKIFPWEIPYKGVNEYDALLVVDPDYVTQDAETGAYRLTERIKKPTSFGNIPGDFELWGIRPEVERVEPEPVRIEASAPVVEEPSLVHVRVLPAEYQPLLDPRQVRFEARRGEEVKLHGTGFGPFRLYKGLPVTPGLHKARLSVLGVSPFSTQEPPLEQIDSEELSVLVEPIRISKATRWKPQRDPNNKKPIEIGLFAVEGLTDVRLLVTGPTPPPVGQPQLPADYSQRASEAATLQPQGPNTYKLLWNGPWTIKDANNNDVPLPRGHYSLVVSGTAPELEGPFSSRPYDSVSLVEVVSIELKDLDATLGRKAVNPGPGGGAALFAEADDPSPSASVFDRLRVNVKVEPVIADAGLQDPVKVYLRSIDVDDPSASARPVDDESASTDNFVPPPPPAPGSGAPAFPVAGRLSDEQGTLVDGGPGVEREVRADGAETTSEFQTSTHQGDNYRVAASTSLDWLRDLSALQGTPPTGTAEGWVVHPSNDEIQEGVQLTEMLTVWRTLHLEVDALVSQNPTADQAAMDLAGTFTALRRTNLQDATGPFRPPDHPNNDDWEGANVSVAFHASDWYDVTGNGTTQVDVRVVPPQPDLTNGLNQAAITALADKSYVLRDDEVISLQGGADHSLAETLLASAYIRLAPEAQPGSDATIPFDPTLHRNIVENLRWPAQVRTAKSYWSVQLLSAFDGHPAGDFDPSTEGVINLGVTTIGRTIDSSFKLKSSVFLETIRDMYEKPPPFVRPSPTAPPVPLVLSPDINKRVTAHEILHTFGLIHDAAIMCGAINVQHNVIGGTITVGHIKQLRSVEEPTPAAHNNPCP